MQRRRFTLWLAASIAVAAFGTPSFAQPQATVAAASDLKFALEEVSALSLIHISEPTRPY